MTGRSKALVVALVVFALAIGVLVGSGPLRALLSGGNSDADDLARARADLEAMRDEAQLGHDFADAAGPAAVYARLQDRTVALVRTADASDDDLATASARLAAAGAQVGATVALTDEWTAEDRGPFRAALAEQITTALTNPPAGDTTSQVLSSALAQALAGGGEFDAAGQENADTLWTLLTEAGLVTGQRTATADLFVLVTPGGDVADLATAFVSSASGAVVGITGGEAGEVGSAASVTRAATFYGAWTLAAALINAANGITGNYDASDAPNVIAGLSQDW